MKKIILFILSALFLVACTGMEKKEEQEMGPMVMGRTYQLEGSIDKSTIDITFGEDQLSGSAGVNRYFAPYTIEGSAIEVEGVATTRIMGPENLMKQEMEFVGALKEVAKIKFIEGKLVFEGIDGKEMVFVEKPKTLEEQITGKTFVLESSLPGHEITLKLAGERLGGRSGVNNYSAAYELEGDKLTISPQIITTLMAGPEEAMKREGEYLSQLSKAERVEYIDGRLIITLKDGKKLIFK